MEWIDDQVDALVQELGISESCALDVFYLRTRSRWSEELEEELIALHKAGTPPNINEFGCTLETGEGLMSEEMNDEQM